jgi:hypothetical protein
VTTATSLVLDATSLSSSTDFESGDLAIAVTAGVALYLWGLAFALWPGEIAHANDSRGPTWIRNFSPHGPDPARPGRTSPNLVLGTGILLLVMGLAFLIGIAVDMS